MVSVFTKPDVTDLISWKLLLFAPWFPTLVLCSPNLPRVYIRLCEHGNHFIFLKQAVVINIIFLHTHS